MDFSLSKTLLTGVCVAVVAMGTPTAAGAATFTVNEAGDQADAMAGDGVCDHDTVMAGLQCTLRAAVDQADAGAGSDDTIKFASGLTGVNIMLTTDLQIDTELTIAGGNCGTSSAPQPCVGVDANGDRLVVSAAADGVDVRGLAVHDADPGIDVSGDSFTLRNSWLGLRATGVVDPNGYGLQISGDSAAIGGTAAADRNVFISSDVNIFVTGDENRIRGNYLGTTPGGTTAAGDADFGIEISGSDGGAAGNVIGASISSAGQATASCDKGCNVIANASHGIILTVDDPVTGTTIKGNFIGLDKTGTGALPNTSTGVNVGTADGTTVGGGSAAERNFITGGLTGVIQSLGSSDLKVKRNFIGLDSAGSMPLSPPDQGTAVNSDLGGPTTVSRNRFALGDLAVYVKGAGARVVRNKIGLDKNGGDLPDAGDRGILVEGRNSILGEPGAGNTIGNLASTVLGAIEIRSTGVGSGDENKVQGNYIGVDSAGVAHGNAGVGVLIYDSTDKPEDNTIGGTSADTENVISNTGGTAGDAIRIANNGNGPVGNDIKRNRGKANGDGDLGCGGTPCDLFIDLDGSGFGNGGGPNNAIMAPTITNAAPGDVTKTHIEGSGAKPNATIYIFRTSAVASFSPNRINAFVKMVTADSSGDWSANFSQIPSGQRLTALQLDSTDGSSELALAIDPVGP